MFNGMRVISSPHLPRFKKAQFRFPRCKGKRVHAKWAKKDSNFKMIPFSAAYVIGGHTLVMHPDEIALLKLSKENF